MTQEELINRSHPIIDGFFNQHNAATTGLSDADSFAVFESAIGTILAHGVGQCLRKECHGDFFKDLVRDVKVGIKLMKGAANEATINS